MSIETVFKQAAEDVKKLKTNPTDDELLELYALYKQAEVGDCNTARPGFFDVKGKFKWEAWNNKRGLDKEGAQQQYVARSRELIQKYGLKTT